MPSLTATIGSFDGVHKGHLHLLRQLAAIAGERRSVPAVVTFTNHPLQVINPDKAPALLSTPEEKRRLLMDAGAGVVILKPFTEEMRRMSAARFLKLLHERYAVNTLLLGFNNRFGNDPSLTFADYQQLGKEAGIEVVQADEVREADSPVSSTVIRQLLLDGKPEQAAQLLGRPYSITGNVVHGKQIGRQLGFPTANIRPDSQFKLIPARGVYACTAILPGGKRYPAMVNIGERPTLDETQPMTTIEAHIIGVNRKLYGTAVTLLFHHFLRHEKKFSSLDRLKAQLQADKLLTIDLLEFKDGATGHPSPL